MNENEPQLPEDIRKALKKSPALTPPESFYRGVLEKIERHRTPTPWYFGFPMRGLATVCVLAMIVLVTRETQKTQPELSRMKSENKEKTNLDEDLAESKPVQDRLSRNIAGLVGNPSPFEEEDAELRKQLDSRKDQAAPILERLRATDSASRREFALQDLIHADKKVQADARATVNGPVDQKSFAAQQAFGQLKSEAASKQSREWQGEHSGITTFRTAVIRSPQEWQTLWKEHTNYIIPPPPAPDVDFDHWMVVGIFAGTKPTLGYGITIININTRPEKVVVSYQEASPSVGMAVAAVVTQPYDLKVIPATFLPVIFESVR